MYAGVEVRCTTCVPKVRGSILGRAIFFYFIDIYIYVFLQKFLISHLYPFSQKKNSSINYKYSVSIVVLNLRPVLVVEHSI